MNIIDPKVAVEELNGWTGGDDFITKVFKFNDFIEAFSFMTNIAMIAENMENHPEWYNVYNRVDITLRTHDSGGVTEKDILLAKAMEIAAS